MTFANALRRRRPRGAWHANITSLVDIMLVLVLQMTFVFATQSSIISDTRPSALPATTHGHMDTSGVHMVLTMDAIRVENTQVMVLEGGTITKGREPQLVQLRQAVEQALARKVIASTCEESLINRAASVGWLYLDAVHNIPYTTIEAVTHTAQRAGLEHFRFIVHAKR
jgi:biopolymer transport protein ExbD